MEAIFLNPWIRYAIVLVHICAGLFWMGWILFIFLMLVPVVRRSMPEVLSELLPALQKRVRKAVFWMILVILVTGLFNMYYLGLFDLQRLFQTGYGHRFLTKAGTALLLFSIYFLAPYLTEAPVARGSEEEDSCCSHEEDRRNLMGMILHVVAFLSGMTAAYLGLSL